VQARYLYARYVCYSIVQAAINLSKSKSEEKMTKGKDVGGGSMHIIGLERGISCSRAMDNIKGGKRGPTKLTVPQQEREGWDKQTTAPILDGQHKNL